MSEFTVKKATRVGIKPLIVLYSESGCGKSYSALLLARGMAGPSGKIVVGDSESGRGSLYADVLPGGYDVVEITDPFTPARYVRLIETIEQSGAVIGIIDSGSHEWEMGVLDMAAQAEEKSGKPGLHIWRQPKLEHAKFVLKLLRSTIPWIVCLRAKYKSRQGRDEKGKTVIIKDDHTSPIQADDFIFEATCHAEIMHDHSVHLTKCSHPGLKACFPEKGPITVEHGKALAAWCAAPTVTANQPAVKPSDETSALKKHLWKITQAKHGGDAAALQQWLWDEALINLDETLANLSLTRLEAVLLKVEAKLKVTT